MSSRGRRPSRGPGPTVSRHAPAVDEPADRSVPVRLSARPTIEVAVGSTITLGQVLKLAGSAGSGGQAKVMLASGDVTVNGQRETRRGRKLAVGDMVGMSDRVLLLVGGETVPADEALPDPSPSDRD